MELKNENTETLTTKLHTTKRIMQVCTLASIITVGFLLYGWITDGEGVDSSLSLVVIALGFFVITLDRKHKRIKAELTSRDFK